MIKELGSEWPNTIEGYERLYRPIKETMVGIAKQLAKQNKWSLRWSKHRYFGHTILTIHNPNLVNEYLSEIKITFMEPKDAMEVDRDYRSPWPSVEGVKLNKMGTPSLYITPTDNRFRYRKLSEAKARFAKDLLKLMAEIPGSYYKHSND